MTNSWLEFCIGWEMINILFELRREFRLMNLNNNRQLGNCAYMTEYLCVWMEEPRIRLCNFMQQVNKVK